MQVHPLVIFVDGYNVIRNTTGLAAAEAVSLAEGRDALLARLRAKYRHTPHRVVVVFDGAGPAETVQPIKGLSRGQVIFTRAGESADAKICLLAEGERLNGQEVRVVSDDIEIRQTTAATGATPAHVADLTQHLGEPPAYLRRRMHHQMVVRQLMETREGEDSAAPRKGNPRRKPRKRRPGDRKTDLL